MLHELQPDSYERLRSLFSPLRYNLLVDSILDGTTPAWVYADDGEEPRYGLLWNRYDSLLLAGQSGDAAFNHELLAFLGEQVVPDARSRHIPELALNIAPATWKSEIGSLLRGWGAQPAGRRYYQPGPLKLNWRDALPPGYEVQPLEPALLQDERLHYADAAAGWVRSFWPSFAAFADRGFGYAILHEGNMASWCLSVYASSEQYELGVATVSAYRGQGLATVSSAACVAHCFDRGYTPHWHCWDDNLPSIAVAEKVGFVNPTHYSMYRFAI